MYVLLALVAACSLGIAAHFLLPHRDRRGTAIAPALSTVAAGVIYTVMQWAGVGQDSVWIWLASILGGVAIGAAGTFALSSARVRSDAAQKAALGL